MSCDPPAGTDGREAMRVGIFFGNQAPGAGGAYTFQSTVFAAIRDLAATTSHEFTVFCTTEMPGGPADGTGSVRRANASSGGNW